MCGMCIDAACAVQACVDGRLLAVKTVYGASERAVQCSACSVHVLAETRRMFAACDGHARHAEKGK